MSDSGQQPHVPAPREPFDPAPPGDRATTALDAYRRAVDTMRDTTKWIVAFVPGAGLIVTLAQVVPALAALPADRRGQPTALLLLAALATAAALVFAGRVLAAAPSSWEQIVEAYARESRGTRKQEPAGERSLSAELDRSGILHLYGYRSAGAFFDQVAQLEMSHAKSAVAVGTLIIDFATFREVRARFVTFLVAGVVAALVAVTVVAAAQSSIATLQDAAITPVRVAVTPTDVGSRRLAEQGCRPAAPPVTAWLLSGSVAKGGTIVIDTDACPPAQLRWEPREHGVLVPAPGR